MERVKFCKQNAGIKFEANFVGNEPNLRLNLDFELFLIKLRADITQVKSRIRGCLSRYLSQD